MSKRLILSAAFAVVAASSLAKAQEQTHAAADFFATPAMKLLCTNTTTPTGRPGMWAIDRPSMAASETALFSTMRLQPVADGEYAIVKIDRAQPESLQELIRFRGRVHDLEYRDGKVFALFADHLLVIDGETGSVEKKVTTLAPAPGGDHHADAQAMAWMGEKLVIVHGTRGLVVYDAKAGGMTFAHPLGLEAGGQITKAIEVSSLDENRVIIVVDNLTVRNEPPYPFNGLMVVDFKGSNFIERYAYDRKTSGTIANAIVKTAGDKIIINNWGVLQTTSLTTMKQAKKVDVAWQPLRIEVDGQPEYAQLMGEFFYEGGSIHACAQVSYRNPETGRPVHKGTILVTPLLK